jgi:hypothetical protein
MQLLKQKENLSKGETVILRASDEDARRTSTAPLESQPPRESFLSREDNTRAAVECRTLVFEAVKKASQFLSCKIGSLP